MKLHACYGTKYGDGSQSDGQDAESLEEDDLINDDPQKPLSWVETPKEGEKTIVTDPAREEKLKILGSLGLKEEDILDTMEKYYADCLKQMTEVGTGQKQFVNVIPNTLWATLSKAMVRRII